jgi:hypothetical protein
MQSVIGIVPVHLQCDTAGIGRHAYAKGMPDDLAASLDAYAHLLRCQAFACAGAGDQGT